MPWQTTVTCSGSDFIMGNITRPKTVPNRPAASDQPIEVPIWALTLLIVCSSVLSEHVGASMETLPKDDLLTGGCRRTLSGEIHFKSVRDSRCVYAAGILSSCSACELSPRWLLWAKYGLVLPQTVGRSPCWCQSGGGGAYGPQRSGVCRERSSPFS